MTGRDRRAILDKLRRMLRDEWNEGLTSEFHAGGRKALENFREWFRERESRGKR
jgi:hypothetical protein